MELDAIRHSPPDPVLPDLMRPGLDGMSVCRDLRKSSDRAIDRHVKKLRQKLHELRADAEYVHCVYGIGYKFEMPVQ